MKLIFNLILRVACYEFIIGELEWALVVDCCMAKSLKAIKSINYDFMNYYGDLLQINSISNTVP